MIVKILQKSATFKAVRYNSEKVENDRGELLLVQNFGILNGIENHRPQDYINYLEALSSRNNLVKYPQFHVAISAKGRTKSKEELSAIAQQWMQEMGYGMQPYLLIYHKDTANNHIHIVSTRIGRDGKKIADPFEKIRAYKVLNQILGENEQHTLAQHVQQALSYSFSTRAQFALLLEQHGYALQLEESVYKISKYGRAIAEVDISKVDAAIANRDINRVRITQIRAILQRYSGVYDKNIHFTDGKYSSALADFLYDKFGLQVIFHGKEAKVPYGYSVIDHHKKFVFKGGEILSLREFIGLDVKKIDEFLTSKEKEFDHLNSQIINKQDDSTNSSESIKSTASINSLQAHSSENFLNIADISIHISDDVDDEAVHNRKRKGKKCAGSPKR